MQPTTQQLFTILSYALSTLQVLTTQNGCGIIAHAVGGVFICWMGWGSYKDSSWRSYKDGKKAAPKDVCHRRWKVPCEVLRKTSMRPPSFKQSGPLYLRPLEKPKRDVVSNAASGSQQNHFLCEGTWDWEDWSAQTSGSPTSVRKTTVHKLQKAGFSNDKIAAITGHRNEQQLRGYAMADMQDHQHISSILSKPCTVPPPVFQRDPSQQQVQLHKLLCVHK